MTVKDFIEQYKEETDVVTYAKSHIVTDYIPTDVKIIDCERIINASYYYKDPVTENKQLHINSVSTYLLFIMKLVDRYTDIEVDFTNYVSEYDTLNKSGFIDIFRRLIPEVELGEYNTFLKMTESDLMQNEYYIGAYLTNKFNTLTVLGEKVLVPVLETLGEQIQGLDENKIKSITDKLLNNKALKKMLDL